MAKVKVVMNSAGAREILNSAGVQAALVEQATSIQQRANAMGSGKYVVTSAAMVGRAHAWVRTADVKAMASNQKHNTLIKAMG